MGDKGARTVFVVLFRGVGGDTKLPTAPLRLALTEAGFGSVATYIATGNVVLTAMVTADEVRARVAAVAEAEFDFAKPIMVLTREEWAELSARNPFPEAVSAPKTLHAFILEAVPSTEAVDTLIARAAPSERVVVEGRVLYFHAPDGFGTSKLPPVIDRTLQVATTARNWNTVLKLEALANKAAAAP